MPCTQTNVSSLLAAANECNDRAAETKVLSTNAVDKCQQLIQFAVKVEDAMDSIKSKRLSPSTFKKIVDLMKEGTASRTMEMARGMEDIALECEHKSRGMKETVERSLPEWELEHEEELHKSKAFGGGDEDDEDLEKHVDEVSQWTQTLRDTKSMFSIIKSGRTTFGGVVSKTNVCMSLFERIRGLCVQVCDLSQGMEFDGSCWSLMQSGVGGVKDMLRCVSLSKIIIVLSDIARRLAQAIYSLLDVLWGKVRDFLDQFVAAKQIKNWVHGMNPFRKGDTRSMVGYEENVPPSQ